MIKNCSIEFKEDSLPDDDEHSPICRYTCNGILVDVMPDDENVLGFSNPWFREGRKHAVEHSLPDGPSIRIVPAIYLLATKLVAYFNRSKDMLSSKDAEDIVMLVNGRDALLSEVVKGSVDLRDYIGEGMTRFVSERDFEYLLNSALDGEEEERFDMVVERFNQLAGMESQH